jgi:hypothetical protein
MRMRKGVGGGGLVAREEKEQNRLKERQFGQRHVEHLRISKKRD